MGVRGGLILMILFILTIYKGFSYVGQVLRSGNEENPESQFFVWAIGASLFAHAATMISLRYFDQSVIFLYMTLGAIGSIWSWTLTAQSSEKEAVT